MPKFIFHLTGTNANGPALIFFNVRGTSYKFFWSEQYRKHIFDNRELNADEFNKLSVDFSGADPMENSCGVVGRFVGLEGPQATNEQTEEASLPPEAEPDLTLSERREFLKTISELEAKLKARKGGRPRKNPETVSKP